MQRRTAEAAAAEPAWPDDAIEVGRIVDAYGIKGWIKVQAFSDDPQALLASRRWFVAPPEDRVEAAAPDAALPSALRVIEARAHAGSVVAGVKEISDRSAAEASASPTYRGNDAASEPCELASVGAPHGRRDGNRLRRWLAGGRQHDRRVPGRRHRPRNRFRGRFLPDDLGRGATRVRWCGHHHGRARAGCCGRG